MKVLQLPSQYSLSLKVTEVVLALRRVLVVASILQILVSRSLREVLAEAREQLEKLDK